MKRRIVINVCHGCMCKWATYGEIPRRWAKVGDWLYCRGCLKQMEADG